MNKVTDWSQFKNFKPSEFECKHCRECHMDNDFMTRLQALRDELGKPIIISSGYRCDKHPSEINKEKPGTGAHCLGMAVDIPCVGEMAYRIVSIAVSLGFTGIGISQKAGKARYVHIDTAPRKAIWSY